jgi:hypothetical protein
LGVKKIVFTLGRLDFPRFYNTPEKSLGFLETIIRSPDEYFLMQGQSYPLDWKDVRVKDKPEVEGNAINLAEFSVTSKPRRLAVFVSFSMEAKAAV